jgi:hypothetical protein
MNNNKSLNICVTTVTNKGYKYLPNIINNFIRQIYPYKKLIIIFNSADIKKETVVDQLYSNGIIDCIVEIISDKTLGQCLNYSIQQIPESYDIWCKMDDDDYYGENYLMTNLESMLRSKADIVGRRDMYIYVPEWKKLFFKKNGGNNILVPWVQGASLFVKKKVFNKVMFPDKNRGEDTHFGHAARRSGFKTFAAPFNDFIVVRRLNNRNHTWLIDLKQYLKNSVVVSSKIFKNFKGFDNHILE